MIAGRGLTEMAREMQCEVALIQHIEIQVFMTVNLGADDFF